MRVMAQLAMVMNLDKCIGCHTCSVTCKQAWTNRPGVEYVWFNNVETRPGQGYPRTLRGPGAVARWLAAQRRGRLKLRAGGRSRKLLESSPTRTCRRSNDYYEPWTYDYETCSPRPLGEHSRSPGPKSLISGEAMKMRWSAELGRRPRRRHRASRRAIRSWRSSPTGQARVRADLHVLPAADLRALPEPVVRRRRARPARCTSAARTASCWSTRTAAAAGACASPAAPTRRSTSTTDRQGREVHVLLPAHRGRPADGLLGDLRRPAALHRPAALRRRPRSGGRLGGGREGPVRGAARPDPRPARPGGRRAAARRRHPRRLDRGRAAFAGVRAGQDVPGGAAAAPGVPDHADGLVHPAAVAGRRRRSARPATTARTRTTCSARSTRCGSRSSISPSCSPPATRRRSTARCSGLPRCARTCAR